MKKTISILSMAFIGLLTMEACKKNDSTAKEQAKKNLAVNILGKWKAKDITAFTDGFPSGTTIPVSDTAFYIFNTDTIGSNTTATTPEHFTYKVIDGNNIKIGGTNCIIKIDGLNMHMERYYSSPLPGKEVINFTKDEIGSLYEILTGTWNITSYKKTENNVITTPATGATGKSFFIFTKDKDTTVSYRVGFNSEQEYRSDTLYKVIGPYQFILDTLQTNITIIDPLNFKLNMVSTKNTTYKKEFTINRK